MNIKDYKIGIYLRIAQEDEFAIKRQEELCKSYCNYKNYQNIVKIYKDNGYSGTKENRPAYKRMLKDVRDGKINVIVVSDFSRLSRQPILFLHKMMKYITEKKLIIISVVESKLSDEKLFHTRLMCYLSLKREELEDGGVV